MEVPVRVSPASLAWWGPQHSGLLHVPVNVWIKGIKLSEYGHFCRGQELVEGSLMT